MMYHAKKDHESTVQTCKYFKRNKCYYDDSRCWFAHRENDKEIKSFKCKQCNTEFDLKSDLLKHRKINHEDSIQECKFYQRGSCKFKKKCWFRHSESLKSDENISNVKLNQNLADWKIASDNEEENGKLIPRKNISYSTNFKKQRIKYQKTKI